MRIEVAPILDLIEAVNWVAVVNHVLKSAMTPQQVADLPEESLWVIGAMFDRMTEPRHGRAD